MIKGQVISGAFNDILMRVKAGVSIELGELLVIEQGKNKILLQVTNLTYGSQLSQQNLEMVAGMNLEEENLEILEEEQRTYQLASLKPMLFLSDQIKMCKMLPPFFSTVRSITAQDLSFMTTPPQPLFLGNIRSGSLTLENQAYLPGKETLSHHVLIAASTGKGKSNLMSCILWDLTGKNYGGLLVLDPHDEYYGRTDFGLKNHPQKQCVSYYTPINPPVGAKTLKLNITKLKPEHFQGAIALSDPQRHCLYAYHKKFKEQWILSLLDEKHIEKVQFHEDTLAVVKRKLISLLGLDFENGNLTTQGIFDMIAGEHTVTDICHDLENGKTVIIDTSYFSGAIEILIGTMITSEIFDRYKYYKRIGQLDLKPVVSVVLEEAPRVIGKKVLEQGSNIFETLAREGRKFKVGLLAITQLPSEIPKTILANMNTKIILGMEMGSERQAIIESSPQDLSSDSQTIASLDKGEALITSTFTRFAIPVRVPLFKEFAKTNTKENVSVDTSFFSS